MDENLWAGTVLKLEYAEFHLQKMGDSIQPAERTHFNAAREAAGTIIDTRWQRSFYAYFDAFISAARSIPEIIQCCFGTDRANREMKTWFDQLPVDERDRRRQFSSQFMPAYDGFRALPLGAVRHVIEHRSGVAPATVSISGLFGVIYAGGPATPVPISETRQIDDPALSFLGRPRAMLPKWDDFKIEGRPLFPESRAYLDAAVALRDAARGIALQVHGGNSVTWPPI